MKVNSMTLSTSPMQMRSWKAWEKETKTMEYQFSNGTFTIQ